MTSARVLVGCEVTGMVRDAFLSRGFDAWSCDLRPSRSSGPHIIGDIRRVIRSGCWHCAIVFPPCQYLSASGLHWNRRDPDRAAKTEAALSLVVDLFDADGNVGAGKPARLHRFAHKAGRPVDLNPTSSARTPAKRLNCGCAACPSCGRPVGLRVARSTASPAGRTKPIPDRTPNPSRPVERTAAPKHTRKLPTPWRGNGATGFGNACRTLPTGRRARCRPRRTNCPFFRRHGRPHHDRRTPRTGVVGGPRNLPRVSLLESRPPVGRRMGRTAERNRRRVSPANTGCRRPTLAAHRRDGMVRRVRASA